MSEEYADLGYINYSPNVIPTLNDPSESGHDGTVDIEITINEGYRYSISKLVIEGADQEDEIILREYLMIVPGEFGWFRKLRKGIDKINMLNEFRPIDQDQDLVVRSLEDSREVIVVLHVSKID